MNDVVLRVDRLTRTVAEKTIVDDVSFAVVRGELLAISGPSGAGKSSLLRLLNRLDEPSSGTVWLRDADCRNVPPRELRRQIGMIMQRAFLFPGTVAANLKFGPEQQRQALPPEQIAELLTSVGLNGFEDRDVATLSGGEAQRVSFARALANQPEVLLLDEPTSSLDEAAAQRVEAVIVEAVRTRGLACVMVTHNTAQAERIASRTMLFRSGRVERISHAEPAHP